MSNLEEFQGDLFSSRNAIGHCVSADMKMTKGIAKVFKKKFGRVEQLKRSGARVGDVRALFIDGRWVYYLITKDMFFMKPSYSTLENALMNMKRHAELEQVKNIDLPRLGCGLDGLEWSIVKPIINYVFYNSDIKIRIFYINDN